MCDDDPILIEMDMNELEERAIDSLTPTDDFLWEADPNCVHDIQSASGGGIRCTKCSGWFCY